MSILGTVRDLDRLRQITQVLIRHGFGHLAGKMGLPGAKKAPTKDGAEGKDGAGAADDVPARPQLGERLRLTLQDLGTTFVKLGQIVSTRPDLVPEDIVTELKKLQDDVKPFPTEQAREQVERELGGKIEDIYDSFADEPLACASVAQVYLATLKPTAVAAAADGSPSEATAAKPIPVVVKVQRPNIENTVERDINLLHALAKILESTVPEAKIYSPTGLVSEFEQAIKAEMDFTVEAQNAERFAANFATQQDLIRFPQVYREASSKRVLTLELFDGIKINDAVKAGADGKWLAENAVGLLLKMVFEDGFFHADPHPGNILILPKPDESGRYAPGQSVTIGMLDLGLVGRLSPELRDKTTDLLLAAARNDGDAIADALLAIGKPRKRVDRAAFREYTRKIAERHLGKALKDVEASAVFTDLVGGALKFQIEIPAELTMLFRAIITIEGVGKEVHPELDVLAVAKPYLAKILMQRYHPARLAQDLWRDVGRLGTVARELPVQLTSIIEDLQRGDLRVQSVDRDKSRAIERLGRRLRAGLVTLTSVGAGVALLIGQPKLPLGQVLIVGGFVWLAAHLFFDWRHQKKDADEDA